MKKNVIAMFLLSLLPLVTVGQKRTLLEGSLKGLKGQKSFNLVFRYDSMTIGDDGKTEKAYLREKKFLWDDKEPGKGEEFIAQWFRDRKNLYEPAFIATFIEYGHLAPPDKNAKYTLIVKTTRTEGGWFSYVINNPGEIDGEVWVVESSDNNHVLAKIGFYRLVGDYKFGGDFEMTKRIQSAYKIAGKGIGDFIRRKSR